MIITGLLLLLGTNISLGYAESKDSTEITINEHNDFKPIIQSFGMAQGPPFVKNFIHQGSNYFFKPQFIVPSTHVIPSIKSVIGAGAAAECEEVKVEDHVPGGGEVVIFPNSPIVEEVEINFPPSESEVTISVEPKPEIEFDFIPPKPVLPPLAHPGKPVLMDESIVDISEPCDQEGISTYPVITDVIIQNPTEIVVEKVVIPQAPKLPSLQPLPELPIKIVVKEPCPEVSVVEVEKLPTEEEFDTYIFPEIVQSVDEPTKTIVFIPPPPEIPMITLPKLPLDIVLPESETIIFEPNVCVRDIVVERVIPNIVLNKRLMSNIPKFVQN